MLQSCGAIIRQVLTERVTTPAQSVVTRALVVWALCTNADAATGATDVEMNRVEVVGFTYLSKNSFLKVSLYQFFKKVYSIN